jgi:hypothetical protein
LINLRFTFPDGDAVMAYDVHPASQAEPIPIPAGASGVAVWLGVRQLPINPEEATSAIEAEGLGQGRAFR